MSDIFQEVEEDLRRDKWNELWDKYGSWLLMGMGGFVIVIGGLLWWGDFQEKQREARSDQFLEAARLIEEGNVDAGLVELDAIIAKGDKGYAALALLRKGSELNGKGDREGAIAAYEQLAASNLGNKSLRDLAMVKAGWLLAETADFETLQVRLAPVVSGESEWSAAAKEIVAFGAFKDGELETARSLYTEILRDRLHTTQGIQGRSSNMLAIIIAEIGPEEIEPVEAPADETSAPSATPASDEAADVAEEVLVEEDGRMPAETGDEPPLETEGTAEETNEPALPDEG